MHGQFVIAGDEDVSDDEDIGSDLRSASIPNRMSSDPRKEGLSNGTAQKEIDRSSPLLDPVNSNKSIPFQNHTQEKRENSRVPATPDTSNYYYIKAKDTLMGISLKLGIDVSAI